MKIRGRLIYCQHVFVIKCQAFIFLGCCHFSCHNRFLSLSAFYAANLTYVLLTAFRCISFFFGHLYVLCPHFHLFRWHEGGKTHFISRHFHAFSRNSRFGTFLPWQMNNIFIFSIFPLFSGFVSLFPFLKFYFSLHIMAYFCMFLSSILVKTLVNFFSVPTAFL